MEFQDTDEFVPLESVEDLMMLGPAEYWFCEDYAWHMVESEEAKQFIKGVMNKDEKLQ